MTIYVILIIDQHISGRSKIVSEGFGACCSDTSIMVLILSPVNKSKIL